MKISKKRLDSTAIVVIDGKIYNGTISDDSEWDTIVSLCDNLKEEFDENELSELLDILNPERIALRKLEEDMRLQSIQQLQLDFDPAVRMRKAKRIADISDLFEYDEEGFCYLKGYNHPMPSLLVEALLEAKYNPNSRYTLNSLLNFYKCLLLNPDKHVRDDAFKWFKTGKFSLTEDGCIIAYRNVNVKTEASSDELSEFITEQYFKIKRWKKSPKNYHVYEELDSSEEYTGNYCLGTTDAMEPKLQEDFQNWERLGSLAEMYADLNTDEDQTVYTDWYSGSTEIRLGEEVIMDRSECDNSPDASCSRGLHGKSASHAGTYGGVTIVMLVNPYNIVAIPNYDHSKFRSCAYLPLCIAETEGNKISEWEEGTYDLTYSRNVLEEIDFSDDINTELSKDEFDSIVNIKETISKRVIMV
jgi:hypothetical protein